MHVRDMRKTIIIAGNKFDDQAGFYAEVEKRMTKDQT
jgi:hypothetical protein